MALRASTLALACLCASPLAAQEDAAGKLTIELNSVEPEQDNCRMSFVILNGHDDDIKSAVFEAVLFDIDGRVDRLTLFDFGALPASRPRVRQFVVPQLACDQLARVLINGAQTCETDVARKDLCTKQLDLKSRIEIEVVG
ncbi:hypothetical protein [Primorskyibacter marinus]|uniref:hypothetical protein n=1 Tax=Primorskyibacter marinus TaxID=1977320 RepID=UPI000E306300|nr:hypothetical protein [Primorskyibacter marinus]